MIEADCWSCAGVKSDLLKQSGNWAESISFQMYVCPYCGNKRCDAAQNHNSKCSFTV